MVIGVTGSFGSGKTTVAKLFARCGATVIDADALVHKLISPGNRVYREVLREFGQRILGPNGEDINRKALAEIVFNNKSALRKLCGIIHPAVIRDIKARIRKNSPDKDVIIDAPLLIEAGLNRILDKLVVVKADKSTQAMRVIKKTGLSRCQIDKRISFQMPLKEKSKLADFIIDNNGSKSETERQVRKIWERLQPHRSYGAQN